MRKNDNFAKINKYMRYKNTKYLGYLAIIIVVVILLFGFYNKKSNEVIIQPGVYCCKIDNNKNLFIDYKKDDNYSVYLDTITGKTKVNIKASFFSYDSIGFEKSYKEFERRTKHRYYNVQNSACYKIDNDKIEYYVVLYATYKNRWYEWEE